MLFPDASVIIGPTQPTLDSLLLSLLSVEYYETLIAPSGENAKKSMTSTETAAMTGAVASRIIVDSWAVGFAADTCLPLTMRVFHVTIK